MLMAGDAEEGPESVAWDRVGRFFEDMASVGQGVFNRNLKLWGTVSANLRKPEYGTDAMAKDGRRAMATALDNLDDIWTSLTRVPERQQVAAALPTAFLYFGVQKGVERDADMEREEAEALARGEELDPLYALAETAWIRLAPAEIEGLPQEAKIDLSGEQAGAEALDGCLRATKKQRGYRLETYGVARLKPGSYTGFVYLAEPRPRALANLRIVVEEP
jgi:hypothetical protein